MGERAYFIHKEPNGKYSCVYSHWGAGWFWNYITEKTLKREKINMDEIRKRIAEEINHEEIIYIDEPNDIIRFEDIEIEAYIVIEDDNVLTIALTFISNYIQGGIKRKFDISHEYTTVEVYRFLNIAKTLNAIIYYEEEQGKENRFEVMRKIKRFAISHYNIKLEEIELFIKEAVKQ